MRQKYLNILRNKISEINEFARNHPANNSIQHSIQQLEIIYSKNYTGEQANILFEVKKFEDSLANVICIPDDFATDLYILFYETLGICKIVSRKYFK